LAISAPKLTPNRTTHIKVISPTTAFDTKATHLPPEVTTALFSLAPFSVDLAADDVHHVFSAPHLNSLTKAGLAPTNPSYLTLAEDSLTHLPAILKKLGEQKCAGFFLYPPTDNTPSPDGLPTLTTGAERTAGALDACRKSKVAISGWVVMHGTDPLTRAEEALALDPRRAVRTLGRFVSGGVTLRNVHLLRADHNGIPRASSTACPVPLYAWRLDSMADAAQARSFRTLDLTSAPSATAFLRSLGAPIEPQGTAYIDVLREALPKTKAAQEEVRELLQRTCKDGLRTLTLHPSPHPDPRAWVRVVASGPESQVESMVKGVVADVHFGVSLTCLRSPCAKEALVIQPAPTVAPTALQLMEEAKVLFPKGGFQAIAKTASTLLVVASYTPTAEALRSLSRRKVSVLHASTMKPVVGAEPQVVVPEDPKTVLLTATPSTSDYDLHLAAALFGKLERITISRKPASGSSPSTLHTTVTYARQESASLVRGRAIAMETGEVQCLQGAHTASMGPLEEALEKAKELGSVAQIQELLAPLPPPSRDPKVTLSKPTSHKDAGDKMDLDPERRKRPIADISTTPQKDAKARRHSQ
jgi:hypothetical protein